MIFSSFERCLIDSRDFLIHTDESVGDVSVHLKARIRLADVIVVERGSPNVLLRDALHSCKSGA